jgi:hypothetical protein
MIFNNVKKFIPIGGDNVMGIDTGNGQTKVIDPKGFVDIYESKGIEVSEKNSNDEPDDIILKSHMKLEHYVTIFKAVGRTESGYKYDKLGKFKFGRAAKADPKFSDRYIGQEKFKDKLLIFQALTIAADKCRDIKDPIVIRNMLPDTQIHKKEIYKKIFKGRYKFIFHHQENKEIFLNVSDCQTVREGEHSFYAELKNVLPIENNRSEYERKIISMLDAGSGTYEIPYVVLERDSVKGYYYSSLNIGSRNFGMANLTQLLSKDLEKKNISVSRNEISDAIINHDCTLISNGKEINFFTDIKKRGVQAFKQILKTFVEDLQASNIKNQIGLMFLAGGMGFTIAKALNVTKDNPQRYTDTISGVKIDMELRLVEYPIYHNVISLKDSKIKGL